MKSRFASLLSFFGVMGTIFYLTFGSLGPWLSQILSDGIHWWTGKFSLLLEQLAVEPVFRSLLVDGICAGVGSVLSFLPVIAVLFFCLSVMESCGYLEYISFKVDGLFQKSGLSGFSLIPLLTGFGCSVPAVMAAGKLPLPYDRWLTISLIPFMSCSAKLPVYTMVAQTFYGEKGIFIIGLLYLTGILTSIPMALLFRRLYRLRHFSPDRPQPSKIPSFYPSHSCSLRKPDMGKALEAVRDNVRDFSKKAFTVIFLGSIVVWLLEHFGLDLTLVDCPEDSILAQLGKICSVFFTPLGISDWRIVSALIAGLSAKEAIVSTLAVMAGNPVGSAPFQLFLNQIFTPFTAWIFMVFCLFYVPCIATLTAVRKETGSWRYSLMMLLFQLIFAWILSFLLYHFGLLLK